jgi:UDP-galactopyranose mutase
MPRNGYTEVFENIFEHKNIRVDLETQFEHSYLKQYDHVFYSGQLDRYFDFSGGRLAYRTLRFEEIRVKGDFQGCPVMNYSDAEIPWTRITEHKHFAPWEQYSHSVCYREYSRSCEEGDIPYYPVKLSVDNKVLDYYQTLAVSERNVSFVGRLGAFKYMDMDKAVSEALKISRAYLS